MFETVKLIRLSDISAILMIDHTHLRLFSDYVIRFPTGAFSHSFGLETYIQRNIIHDDDTFYCLVKNVFTRATYLF